MPGLRHRFLSDSGHQALKAYGAWKEKNLLGKTVMGTERSIYLIEPSRTVRAVWRLVKVPGHPDAVREALAALAA